MTRDEIETLVQRFVIQAWGTFRWSDPDECVGLCDEAAEALAFWCECQGIEVEITHEERNCEGRSPSHTVVTIGGWTVDLTARQYDEDAEFPAIY